VSDLVPLCFAGDIHTLDERKDALVVRVVAEEALDGTANLDILSTNAPYFATLYPPYHSVLSHQNDTASTEGQTDLVHLLRADIVDGDDEDGAVVLEKRL
jgi:hypothetical protein